MALDTNYPNDGILFSKLDDYQRETRTYINNLEATLAKNSFIVSTVDNSTGALDDGSLIAGTNLSQTNLEHIKISTQGNPKTLSIIENGERGQIKQFIARDDNITIAQDKTNIDAGSNDSGSFRLNEPASVNLQLNTNDIVVFVNSNAAYDDPTSHGYWQEMYRTLAV